MFSIKTMDTISSRFDNSVKRYFDIMSKRSTQTTEQRVTSLERVKEEFLKNCYSPSFNEMHVLFLGLLHDATYMLKKQTNKTRVTVPVTNPVTVSKKKDTVVSLKTQKPIVLDKFMRPERLSQQLLAGFGETVFETRYIEEVTLPDIIINTELVNNTIKFEFIPEHYLLNNTVHVMDYNIFRGHDYLFAAAYNFLVDKHLKNKEILYGSTNVNQAQFFEIFHQQLIRLDSYVHTHVLDLNYLEDYGYLENLISYIENTRVCFTSFILRYNLQFELDQSTDTKIYIVDDPTCSVNGSYGHVVSVLVYRNLNDIQVFIINNNPTTPPQEIKLLNWFFDYFKNIFTKSLNLNITFKIYNYNVNIADNTKNYEMSGFCGIVSIMLNDILWTNIFKNDVFGFRQKKYHHPYKL